MTLKMLREMGYTNGVENLSSHGWTGEGEPPYTLLDFFPEDFLIMIDESHLTMGQIRACTMVTARARRCWSTMVSVAVCLRQPSTSP